MWLSTDFRQLSAPPPNAQTLWQYLLTGPRTIAIPGVIVARPAVMADDLRWSRRGFERVMAEIVAAGMAEVDLEAGLVVLTKALIVDGDVRNSARLNTINAVKSWISAMFDVPACALRDVLRSRITEFFALLGGEFPKAFAEATGQTCTTSPSERTGRRNDDDATQDQDQDQDQEMVAPAVPAAPALTLVAPEPRVDHAAELWAYQDQRRAAVLPGRRPLTFAADRRRRLVALLKDYTPAELRTVIDRYAAEAPQNDGRYFDGVSNWRPENVARMLNRSGPAPPAPNAPPPRPLFTRITEDEIAR